MVTNHKPGDNYNLFLRKSIEYFDKYGRDDFTLTHYTITKYPSGRIKTKTATTSTIVGDLQFSSKQLRNYIYQGIAKSGDGIFYTLGTNSVVLDDEITVDSKSWKLTRQMEGEDLDKQVPYTGWIAVRIPSR